MNITKKEAKRAAYKKALSVANDESEIKERGYYYMVRTDYVFQFCSEIKGKAYYLGGGVWVA